VHNPTIKQPPSANEMEEFLRIIDLKDTMDNLINIRKWQLNAKRYFHLIHEKGLTPELFFDIIREKNKMLENPNYKGNLIEEEKVE
jgi:hypothetical protein